MSTLSSVGEAMALAINRLGLQHSYAVNQAGAEYWHIPFGSEGESPILVTAYVGELAAGVLCSIGNVEPGLFERFLRVAGEITLAKVALLTAGVAVVAEIPSDHVNEDTLRLAISGVLEGVRKVRAILAS